MDKLRFVQSLKKRIPVRFHMSFIFLSTIFSGIIASKFMLNSLELKEPMFRYGIAVLFSYGIFYILIYCWLRIYFGKHLTNSSQNNLTAKDGIDAVESIKDLELNVKDTWKGHGGKFSGAGASSAWGTDVIPPPSSETKNLLGSSKPSSLIDAADSAEGIIFALCLLVIMAICGAGGYLIVQAPEILFEAAFEVILAAGLLKKINQIKSEGWGISVFKKTWWLCGIIFFIAVAFGAVIKSACPEASSFAQYRQMCSTNN